MKMRWKHRNYIGVSGRRTTRREKWKRSQLTELLYAVPQHVPHVAVAPPEGDTSEGGIPRKMV